MKSSKKEEKKERKEKRKEKKPIKVSMSVQFRINAIGQNLSAGEFDMRGSVNENTEPYDNREEGFKVTSLVTDIVLEVCWAPPDSL